MNRLLKLLLLSALLTSSACQSEQISNIPEDDTTQPISYASQIQPIFNSSCGGSGCHINNTRRGVNLTDYSNTINSVGSDYGREIVVPGDADDSPLVDVLSSNPAASRRMPLNRSPLTASEITLIRSWINQGALNN